MRRLLLMTLLFCFVTGAVSGQEELGSYKPEFGFWVGATSPLPSTKTDEVLDSSIGGGMFLRFKWPLILHTELGLSFANYPSRFSQSLTMVPVYVALSYRLPITSQIHVFMKLGGGASWLEIRPKNRNGWDPLFFGGLEFSIRAGRRLKIGLRLDYNEVYEKHLSPPPEVEYLRYQSQKDPRYYTENEFSLENGSFFNFGLMLSFYL